MLSLINNFYSVQVGLIELCFFNIIFEDGEGNIDN